MLHYLKGPLLRPFWSKRLSRARQPAELFLHERLSGVRASSSLARGAEPVAGVATAPRLVPHSSRRMPAAFFARRWCLTGRTTWVDHALVADRPPAGSVRPLSKEVVVAPPQERDCSLALALL